MLRPIRKRTNAAKIYSTSTRKRRKNQLLDGEYIDSAIERRRQQKLGGGVTPYRANEQTNRTSFAISFSYYSPK